MGLRLARSLGQRHMKLSFVSFIRGEWTCVVSTLCIVPHLLSCKGSQAADFVPRPGFLIRPDVTDSAQQREHNGLRSFICAKSTTFAMRGASGCPMFRYD